MAARLTNISKFPKFSAIRGIRTTVRPLFASKEFDLAKDRVNTLKEDPGNEAKLKLYALFKQATVGACNSPKPGAFDFVGKAKWTAWDSLGSISKEEAEQQYIQYVNDLAAKIGTTEDDAASSATEESDSGKKYKSLEVTVKDGVQTIKLNRPKKYNAITWEMYEEWISALEEGAQDKSCVVTLITGAGDYYCSGNDLGNFAQIPPEGPEKMARDGRNVLRRFVSAFIDYPKPLVAAINGPAVGISVTVLGLFDVVFASDRATFHTPFIELGQSPEGCSSYTFPAIMGPALACQVLLASRKLTAAEALESKLVSEVFLHGDFQREVESRITAMAQLPPKSLQLSKQLIREANKATLHEVNERECILLEQRWLSEECMQAIMKFMQRKAK
ncbi:enoyl-CoA delta isomerase 2, mitochondrial [Exaiptasia diaphana]|uniref:ACB domain-containing protein n=1 Tax=Exaiptasia diaphana TaxID=2652724 RepID=A0A913XWQ9_EXADI|nr:enoyl-CoA delta isomerase 2, mitochondrial [Exaiptasia diaphana]KXJ24222.1 Enoyl-CoA delta isomerase 2, mitochondrial [Exaiptasia diaphana]